MLSSRVVPIRQMVFRPRCVLPKLKAKLQDKIVTFGQQDDIGESEKCFSLCERFARHRKTVMRNRYAVRVVLLETTTSYLSSMILLIDSYDSFSHNLKRLIEEETGECVTVIQNDSVPTFAYLSTFEKWSAQYRYIVIGPGPGNPSKHEDVGIISWIFEHIKRNPGNAIPVLGVCLGFQSMCHAFGNRIKRLRNVRHGQIYQMLNESSSILEGCPLRFPSVRYHSLGIHLNELNEEICPLAFCEDEGEKVVMAGRHRSLPLFGVQYHPESICSQEGQRLIRNFHRLAEEFNQSKGRRFSTTFSPEPDSGIPSNATNGSADRSLKTFQLSGSRIEFGTPSVSPIDLCNALRKDGSDLFLLNSASEPGDWSIVGLPIPGESKVITHSADSPNTVRVNKHGESTFTESTVSSIWEFLEVEMKDHLVPKQLAAQALAKFSDRLVPFCGGFIGLISYEEGQFVEHRNLEAVCVKETPDLKLIFIERVLLYDHASCQWILISIKPNDDGWIASFKARVEHLTVVPMNPVTVPHTVIELCKEGDRGSVLFDFPDRIIYREQFKRCQELLHSGDSYELCLTTQSQITVPSYIDPWDLYKILAIHKNPSPYSSYMCFDDCVLLSSSPERFLCWKNDMNSSGKRIELRPIKGTVKNDESVTKIEAERILKTPKEMGENLMIVDLIRHDLDPFVESVEVSSLMEVETYKTVYQLVSVIQGTLASNSGLDVLRFSLPPGSMTGAPKKRSVQHLSEIESLQGIRGGRRGIYSGVAGYWSVTDEADWSVTIRSVFHYRNDKQNTKDTSVWRIGAGGAITVLSEEQAEWEEMTLKLSSALKIFQYAQNDAQESCGY